MHHKCLECFCVSFVDKSFGEKEREKKSANETEKKLLGDEQHHNKNIETAERQSLTNTRNFYFVSFLFSRTLSLSVTLRSTLPRNVTKQ